MVNQFIWNVNMYYVPKELLAQIESLKDEGKYDEALQTVNWILKKDPLNELALLQVADIEYLRWDISKAEKPVDFILNRKNSDNPMGWYVKWVFEMEKTNWTLAKQFLKKAMELTKWQNPEIMRCFGIAQYWWGNREKGLELLYKANEMNSMDAEILYNLIEINILESRYWEARKFINFFKKNRDQLQLFWRTIEFYDDKIALFESFITNKH